MNKIKMTKHAERRANQRGIRSDAMEIMLAFGATKIRHGCEVVFMDKAARRKVRNTIGKTAYAKIERALDKILVLANDGRLVTCCHRTRPIRGRTN